LEDADGAYKRAIKSGDVPGLLGSFFRNVVAGGSGGNPLEKHRQLGVQMKRGTYEVMNRDSGELFRVVPFLLCITKLLLRVSYRVVFPFFYFLDV
jgi:hypothetical protein